MHATSFSIRNFRLFDTLELTELRPFTLLVGQNNVGKTSVLEAFVAALSRDPIVVPNTLDRARELVPLRVATTAEVFRTLFTGLAEDKVIELRLQGPRGERLVQVSLEVPKEAQTADVGIDETGEHSEPLTEAVEHRVRWNVSINGRQAYSSTAWRDPRPKFAGDTRGSTVRHWEGRDDAPNRAYLSTSMWLGTEFIDAFSQIRKMGGLQPILAVMAEMTPGLQDLQIFTYGGEPRLEATVNNVEMPVQLLGDGTVRALTYLLAATRAQGGYLLVDEIERGIHHAALVKVLRALRRRAADAGTQIIATTHSSECIKAANEAFADDADGLRVIRLERHQDGQVRARSLPEDGLEAALELGLEVR